MQPAAPHDHIGDLVDLTTTSVGRATLIDAYTSFLTHVRFTGRFRVIVTIDPAYAVENAELRATYVFLTGLRDHPKVAEVVVERFSHQVGLAGALTVLTAYTASPIGVHLEDDWLILDTVDLASLGLDLLEQESTQICLANTHVARGGTFERRGEVEHVTGTRVPLLRFTQASWAAAYLPLCPHLHRTERWAPTVARALASSDPLRCPDERIKEHITAEGSIASHNVLWTRQILARDLGRQWLGQRGQVKAIFPAHQHRPPEPALPSPSPRRSAGRTANLLAVADRCQPGSRSRSVAGGQPRFFDRGCGAIVWDSDGHDYVDFDCADGTAILGHNHPAVTNVIRERAAKGVRLPVAAASELAVAQMLIDAVPGADMAHLTCTADDALRLAVSLARHATGRDDVLCVGKGTTDAALDGTLAPVDGAHDLRIALDMVAANDWAAIVVRPPLFRTLQAREVRLLRESCGRVGALAVLDETAISFRLATGGFSALHDVTFDMVVLSHTAAGGMPFAALVGQRPVMRQLPKWDGTHPPGPDLLSVEVAKAVLRQCCHQPFIDQIAQLGAKLRDGLNLHAANRGWTKIADGYPSMPCLRFSPDPQRHVAMADTFASAMAERGVLISSDVLFISAAHTSAQIEFAVNAAAQSLAALISTGNSEGAGHGRVH
jgi:glutamate-1-semialdehyde aminotransferase